MREGAIEGILDDLDVTDTQTIQQLINGFEKPNKNGKYEVFYHVIIHVLKQFLN